MKVESDAFRSNIRNEQDDYKRQKSTELARLKVGPAIPKQSALGCEHQANSSGACLPGDGENVTDVLQWMKTSRILFCSG